MSLPIAPASMTVPQFQQKWRNVTLKERLASQSHVNDLRHMLHGHGEEGLCLRPGSLPLAQGPVPRKAAQPRDHTSSPSALGEGRGEGRSLG